MTTEKQKYKENEEKKYLDRFLNSPIGQHWLQANNIDRSSLQKKERPDFLFVTKEGKTVGIEITKLIVPNENTEATQQLITIGNQVRAYIQKEYNKKISIIIDKLDKHLCSTKWSDHIDGAYHPGFSKLPSRQELKNKIIETLVKKIALIKEGNVIKESIEIDGEYSGRMD